MSPGWNAKERVLPQNATAGYPAGMRLSLALAALMITTAVWAGSQDKVELKMGIPSGGGSAFFANFAVQNMTDRPIDRVEVTCAALNPKGEPLDIGKGSVSNLGPHEVGYGSAMMTVSWYVENHYSCRVEDIE